jgi:hypothetical protein
MLRSGSSTFIPKDTCQTGTPPIRSPNRILYTTKVIIGGHLNQQKFLYEVIAQIEDILYDIEFDLTRDSVIYSKTKDLLSFVENYQEENE